MKKELIECDLCGGEIKLKDGFYFVSDREIIGTWTDIDGGPNHMDICRYCLKNLIEPLGKWPEPVEPTAIPVFDEDSGGGVDPHF